MSCCAGCWGKRTGAEVGVRNDDALGAGWEALVTLPSILRALEARKKLHIYFNQMMCCSSTELVAAG